MKTHHRGQPLPIHHKAGPRGVSLGRVCWASLGPFLAAALLGSVLFRATGSGTGAEEVVVQRHPSRVLEETDRSAACIGIDCSEHGSLAAAEVAGGHNAGAAAAAGAAALSSPLIAHSDGRSSSGLVSSSSSSSDPISSGSSSSSSSSSSQGDSLPQLFLFIGILSGRGYRHRRIAVREAWSNKAQVPGKVVARFILSEDERTPQVEKELEAYGDIVFVRQKTNYKSILYKTYYVMEYAATHYDTAFVLKTDDDAFINVAPLLQQLQALCENPDCRRERLYMGKMAKHSEVLLQPGHKWNNAAFHNHTGLKEYPNYMMGGGYVVGGEVARVLVDIHTRMHLKFTPIEDATLGFWLMAMDLRHVDHPKFYTWAAPCCFKAPVRRPGERFVTRFQLAEEFEADLCSTDPWIILHKIDSPTKMRYVGGRVANCSLPQQPWAMAPSIEQHVMPQQRAAIAQQWPQQRAKAESMQMQQLEAGGATPAADAARGSATDSSSAGLASSGAVAGTGLASLSSSTTGQLSTNAAAGSGSNPLIGKVGKSAGAAGIGGVASSDATGSRGVVAGSGNRGGASSTTATDGSSLASTAATGGGSLISSGTVGGGSRASTGGAGSGSLASTKTADNGIASAGAAGTGLASGSTAGDSGLVSSGAADTGGSTAGRQSNTATQ